jgi:leader peptidase (prepilin peptidase) / N-methyltransferase
MFTRWSNLMSQTLESGFSRDEVAGLIASATTIAATLILLPNKHGIVGSGLAVLMIAIAAIDSRRFIIPNELTAAGLALGLLYAVMKDPGFVVAALAGAALRGAVLAFVFWGLRILYRQIRGRDGIGLGDVKLAGVAGVWLDWSGIPVAIEIAALAALAVYAMRRLRGRATIRLMTRMPFGLFFAPAIWLVWLLETVLFQIPSVTGLQ